MDNYTIESILRDKYEKYLEALDIYENKSNLRLSKIVIKPEFRESGIGKKIMTDLTNYADKNHQIIVLTPSSDFGGNKNRLIQFYKSFGFKHNKGVHINFEFMESMIRYPMPIKQNAHVMEHIKTFESFKLNEEDYDNSHGDKFWGDSGAGVLIICKKTGNLLVSMRGEAVNEPNTWGIFGGKTEEGETPEESAQRELTEESGYKGKYEIIPAYVYTTPRNTFTYYNFIGLVEEEFEPEYDWETAYAEWMSLEKLIKIKPKHFGLKLLLDNSMDIIKKYAK
jgi:8-oxo-dGTP pyrophosphatase MutT (NUDIX family)/predicted GNAT family acetyltransferase